MKLHKTREEPRCLAKHRYATEEQARAAGMCSCYAFSKPCMSVYPCRFCGGYHVTSQPGMLINRVTSRLAYMRIRVAI